jgi:hypothetical protein
MKDRRRGIDPSRTLGAVNAWAGIGVLGRLVTAVAIIALAVWACIQVVQLVGFLALAIAP